MSDMVGGHFLDLTGADDRNGRWADLPGDNRRNGQELTKVIEDFGRAVDVEALRLAKETGKHLSSQPGNILFSVVSCRAAAFA
jgi:hypothetical protein